MVLSHRGSDRISRRQEGNKRVFEKVIKGYDRLHILQHDCSRQFQ